MVDGWSTKKAHRLQPVGFLILTLLRDADGTVRPTGDYISPWSS